MTQSRETLSSRGRREAGSSTAQGALCSSCRLVEVLLGESISRALQAFALSSCMGSLWGPSEPFPAHLSGAFHRAPLFPWAPPRCVTEAATFSSGNPTPFFLVPACVTTCVGHKSPELSFLCLLQPPFLHLHSVLHHLLPPSCALHGHQHEAKAPGCNSCIPSVLLPSPCGVEAAEKASLMWPFPPSVSVPWLLV